MKTKQPLNYILINNDWIWNVLRDLRPPAMVQMKSILRGKSLVELFKHQCPSQVSECTLVLRCCHPCWQWYQVSICLPLWTKDQWHSRLKITDASRFTNEHLLSSQPFQGIASQCSTIQFLLYKLVWQNFYEHNCHFTSVTPENPV